MKSSSITGMAFSLIPADTTEQNDANVINVNADDFTVASNDIYLFTGAVPDASVLSAFETIDAVLAANTSTKAFEFEGFDCTYTFDKKLKERRIVKTPVDSEEFQSAVDGTLGWACIRLRPKSLTSSDHLLLFTDSIGGWDDADQNIMVDTLSVTNGGNVKLKGIALTFRDALIRDLETSN